MKTLQLEPLTSDPVDVAPWLRQLNRHLAALPSPAAAIAEPLRLAIELSLTGETPAESIDDAAARTMLRMMLGVMDVGAQQYTALEASIPALPEAERPDAAVALEALGTALGAVGHVYERAREGLPPDPRVLARAASLASRQ